MPETRLKAGLWVAAALRLAFNDGRGGAVLRRGDPDSGGIILVLRGVAGLVTLSQITAADGQRAWLRATGPDPTTQEAADAYIDRQIARDPDLWVVELDAPDYLPPFDGPLI